MVITRKARPQDLQQVAAFYHEQDYTPAKGREDVIVVAEEAGMLCGALRLCEEHGALVLRGMRVAEDMRRQGIGTRLLQAAESLIADRECFCIPHRHLRSFYACIGFVEIQSAQAPPFLCQRCSRYRSQFGLDVIIMRRTGTLRGNAGRDVREVGHEQAE